MKDYTEFTHITEDKDDIVCEIKKEDKMLRGKYILLMFVCMVGGGIAGSLAVAGAGFMTGLSQKVETVLMKASPYAVLILTVATALLVFLFYGQARKLYTAWDGEEEETLNRMEAKLSIALMVSGIETILFLLFSSIWIASVTDMVNNDSMQKALVKIVCYLVGFVIMMFSQTFGIQNIVNFEKEINPEKKGSVYDVKFQKKWMESCDEAQKMMIYQAGYASYQTVNKLCSLLMLCNMAGVMLWDWGIVPAFMVAIIWGASMLSYYMKEKRLSGE